MKRLLLLLMIVAGNFIIVYAQSPSKIAGAYQKCPFECETYNIKADKTFEYLVDGDLWNNQRTKGTWAFVGPNKIHLISLFNKIIRNVKEIEGNDDSIKVVIVDPAGGYVPGIEISFDIEDKTKHVTTKDNGAVVIPKANTVSVTYRNHTETYKLLNQKTDKLVIEIEDHFVSIIDSEFKLGPNKICKVLDEGEIADCNVKISSKRQKELFPKD